MTDDPNNHEDPLDPEVMAVVRKELADSWAEAFPEADPNRVVTNDDVKRNMEQLVVEIECEHGPQNATVEVKTLDDGRVEMAITAPAGTELARRLDAWKTEWEVTNG